MRGCGLQRASGLLGLLFEGAARAERQPFGRPLRFLPQISRELSFAKEAGFMQRL